MLLAYYLAQNGRPDEDLFGILAVLLISIALGAKPQVTAPVTTDAFFAKENHENHVTSGCTHENLSASRFARSVPQYLVLKWTRKVQLGWNIFLNVLDASRSCYPDNEKSFDPESINLNAENVSSIDEPHIVCDVKGYQSWDRKNYLGSNRQLSTLCAAIQTELLTYRSQDEDMPWVSPNFDMKQVLLSLQTGLPLTFGKIAGNSLMRQPCVCGFWESGLIYHPRAEEVCNDSITNLENR